MFLVLKVACTDFRMLEKFEIHSQLKKKDSLQRLCEQFLEAPCFEGRDTGKVSSNLLLLYILCQNIIILVRYNYNDL